MLLSSWYVSQLHKAEWVVFVNNRDENRGGFIMSVFWMVGGGGGGGVYPSCGLQFCEMAKTADIGTEAEHMKAIFSR